MSKKKNSLIITTIASSKNYILKKYAKLNYLKLKPGVKNIEHNMILCYKKLVQMNLIDKKEIKLLNAWFLDYKNIQ